MIFDLAKNLEFYKGLGVEDRYAKAVEFLTKNDLAALACGKYEIDGQNVYANIMEYTTVKSEEATFEAHEYYTDIQYIVEGTEVITYAPVSQLNISVPYNSDQDVMLFDDDNAGLKIVVHAGEFMIFNPWDGHRPKACDGTPGSVKKVVVKIREK